MNRAKVDAVYVTIAHATLAMIVDGGSGRQTKTDRQTDGHPAGSEAERWQTHH
jgi:hypothetical protein